MAADRGAYIDQSQSLNIHMEDVNYGKLSSMHFYAWEKGLKTGMYYLRTRPAVDPIKFTVDFEKAKRAQQAVATGSGAYFYDNNKVQPEIFDMIPQKQSSARPAPSPATAEMDLGVSHDNAMEQITCSLDNPDACMSCGS